MLETIWIDWENSCRRSMELCRYLNIEPHVIESGKPKSLLLFFRTVQLLVRTLPQVVIVNSMRIAALLLFLKPLLRYRLIVDCHYAGIVPATRSARIFRFLFPIIHRYADLILVTNTPHAEKVRDKGGTAFVLQDRIPTTHSVASSVSACASKMVVCVCSYSSDEPIEEMLHAAHCLANENVEFFFTGNCSGVIDRISYSENVHFTGYLAEDEYWQLLSRATVVVDLTNRENCLVCGAYEAVALGKPLVLSSTQSLREHFTRGVVFTENVGESIVAAIEEALRTECLLAQQVNILRRELESKWYPRGKYLSGLLQNDHRLDEHLLHQSR